MMVRVLIGAALAMALTACATTPTPPPQPAPVKTPTQPKPSIAPSTEAPVFTLRAVSFAELPGWAASDAGPALSAFRASCRAIANRPDDLALGRLAPYGGKTGEWLAACVAAQVASDARAFFERTFMPYEVVAREDQLRRLTGYYEPVIQARRMPTATMDEPFLARPADLIGIDLSQFDETNALSDTITEDVMRTIAPLVPSETVAGVREALDDRLERRFQTPIWGRMTADRRVVPYAARADIQPAGALAYARPCDVYDVQVQGSARVQFEDGVQMRMAYAAQNGWKWNSIYGQMRSQGLIQAANKRSVCAWMDANERARVRQIMNLDPSYVFFALEPLGDPTAGPKGAQGVALTALGSIAVDPAAHPYGAPLFVSAENGFQRLLIAQDTGGAIRRGPVRGDVFFGTGDSAGAAAEQMNAPVRFWTLLPRSMLQTAMR
jgi:membrane-bound lytic murein transglycosylase A